MAEGEDVERLIKRSLARIREGDYDSAVGLSMEAVGKEPENAIAWCVLAWAQCQGGDANGAVRACDQALRLDPHRVGARALGTRGRAKFELGNLTAATKDLDGAIHMGQDCASFWGSRALVMAAKGDVKQGIEDMGEMIRLEPSCAAAYGNRGGLRAQRNDFNGAIADFGMALRIHESAEVFSLRAMAKFKKGDAQGAMDDCNRALRIDPEHEQAKACLCQAWNADNAMNEDLGF